MNEGSVAALALVAVLLVAFFLRSRKLMRHDLWFLAVAAVGLVLALAPVPALLKLVSSLGVLVAFLQLPYPSLYIDPKTGSFTREGLRLELERQLASQDEVASLAVATEHYQDLRMINGDEVMSEVARLMAASLTELCAQGTIAYLGRGRFMVVGDSSFDASSAQARVTERFQHGWSAGNRLLLVPVRTIAMPATNRMSTPSAVIDTIESAIDRILLSDASSRTMDEEAIDKARYYVHVRRLLERALDNQTLEVHYQPLYDTRVRRTTRAEALARLRDDDGQYVSPETFIAIAERAGIIDRLGEQIFEQVCAFASQNDLDKLGLECINVNLSPLQCMSHELPERLHAIAAGYGVPMERLHLEITESAMVDISVLQQQMGVLVSIGSQFSLDDYGTGYSNLTRVATLPFSNIKLDQSLVWSYFRGDSDLLPSIVDVFLSQGLEITAEGVETEEMARELTNMGCHLLQGFFFSRALPADTFVAYVTR